MIQDISHDSADNTCCLQAETYSTMIKAIRVGNLYLKASAHLPKINYVYTTNWRTTCDPSVKCCFTGTRSKSFRTVGTTPRTCRTCLSDKYWHQNRGRTRPSIRDVETAFFSSEIIVICTYSKSSGYHFLSGLTHARLHSVTEITIRHVSIGHELFRQHSLLINICY